MKKHLTFILCLAMLGSVLTGCGDSEESNPAAGSTVTTAVSASESASSDTTASAAANTTGTSANGSTTGSSADTTAASAVTTNSAAGSTAAQTTGSAANTTAAVSAATAPAEQSGDREAAKNAVVSLIKAANDQNKDVFIKYSNMDLMLETVKLSAETAKKNQNTESGDEINIDQILNEYMKQAYASYALGTDYTISDGIYPKNFIENYNQELAENLDQITKEKAKEVGGDALVSLYEKILTPLNKLYVFEIKHGDKSEDFYVKYEDGEWKVDMLSFSMLKYVMKSKISSANSTAKSIYTAFNTALTDMDAENENVSKLNGTYTFKGSDFENLKKNGAKGMDLLKAMVAEFFTDITKMQELTVRIKDGLCDAIAVRPSDKTVYEINTDSDLQVFGAYPTMVTVDTLKTMTSTKDTVDKMKGIKK